MIRTTSSRLVTAMTRPSKIWARSRALASSNLARRVITSSRKRDERLDDVAQVERLGPAAADREHVGREARLRRGVPPELVEHDVGRGVALEVDDDAHALAVRFVANVGDAFDPLVLGGLGDLLDQAVLADLVGDRGEHDRAAVAAAFLDDVARAHHDRAAAGMVGAARAGLAEDQRRGREIGAGNDLDQLVDR